jgi:hypothetical protein
MAKPLRILAVSVAVPQVLLGALNPSSAHDKTYEKKYLREEVCEIELGGLGPYNGRFPEYEYASRNRESLVGGNVTLIENINGRTSLSRAVFPIVLLILRWRRHRCMQRARAVAGRQERPERALKRTRYLTGLTLSRTVVKSRWPCPRVPIPCS